MGWATGREVQGHFRDGQGRTGTISDVQRQDTSRLAESGRLHYKRKPHRRCEFFAAHQRYRTLSPRPLLLLPRRPARQPHVRRNRSPAAAPPPPPPLRTPRLRSLPWTSVGSKAPSFTTASTKKRKLAGADSSHNQQESRAASPSLHDVAHLNRSSPHRSSASPPRYLPPHMHGEVYEAAQEPSSAPRDPTATTASAASSPSDAYANLTLDSNRESASGMPSEHEPAARAASQPEHLQPKPPPRSSSPAKRLHSDMDGASQSGQRSIKALPTAAQRSARASSVEMLDAPAHSVSTTGSDTTSNSADSVPTSVSAQPSPPRSSLPNLDDQVTKVLTIHARPLADGQEGYVISEKWLERVFARTTENKTKPEQFDKASLEGDIGPVDNSDLVDTVALSDDLSDQNGEDFVPLRQGLTMGQDFEVLPVEAWELILSWYGLNEASPVIRRYAHNTALGEFQENIQYELYPPVFTIRRVPSSISAAPASQEVTKRSPQLVASRSDGFVEFLKAAKKAVGLDLKTKVRVWRVLNTGPADQGRHESSGMLTPDASPRRSPIASQQQHALPLLMDAATFAALTEGTERELVTGKDETANEKYNGHSSLHITGLGEDQVLILEEQDEKGNYPNSSKSHKNNLHVATYKASDKSKSLQSGPNSGRSSPVLSAPVTRGRTRSGRTRGTVGLTNLGNTCYMNSALQCIRSVEELSTYFLEENYKDDLNPDNPLGHGGAMAKVYGGLLSQIYDVKGQSSFAPKNFKSTLGRVAAQFSGYGQQDSQEFLSFLVDGLHEDLNRIKQKPYTENPESDDNTVHDPEAIKDLGEKFRQIHRSRNNSVAMDLFNGFYKNTMVCPDCNKVSITFDPYSLVTLQLPIEQTWQHTITFVPLRGKMVNVEIDIDKNSTVKGLKEYIAKRFEGVNWERLMGAEIYTHKFYRSLENNKTIAECNIGQRDVIYFYELATVPTNWPPRKKKNQYRTMLFPHASSEEDIPKSASPMSDRMLVPIFHRSKSMSTYRGAQWSLVLWPSYIVLTREEAKDQDLILQKLLGKIAQMTTRPILTEFGDTTLDQSRTGSDIILTTEEDASSNGDPRVHDGSVEGEDMVEVTMTEPVDAQVTSSSENELPEVLRPGAFIAPAFRQLFEVKHTRAGKEMVPTGWSSIDANKPYEPISKRIRVEQSRQSSIQSFEGDENSNASSSEEIEDVTQFSADAQSSIDHANQSSEEELPSIETESFSRDNRYNSKKNRRKNQQKKHRKKNPHTYSKKGKDRSIIVDPSPSDTEMEEEEGLIRLGEALVLDWTQEAYEALFEGSPNNTYDDRGTDALKRVETLHDRELEAKKAKRAARKKNGITLEECFAETSKSEVLSEDNAWYCNRCKELRRATKTLEIWTTPDILVIHLKRFSAHRTFRDKVDAFVDCPIDGLDLSGKVGLPEDKSLIYDLFAVDNHYGGLGGGHYTACARNFYDGKWYDYNDSSVSQRDPSSVVTQAAYLLFYRRRSDHPLGPEYLQKIVLKARNPVSEESDTDDTGSRTASRSPAGNGLRLDGSSRNGSSSAFAAGAGARAGAGSISTAENLRQRGVAAGTVADDDETMLDTEQLPGYSADEGFVDADDDDANFNGININKIYEPLYRNYGISAATAGEASWGFGNLPRDEEEESPFNDNASMNAGSGGEDDMRSKLMEDFGDEIDDGIQPGLSTPLVGDEDMPELVVEGGVVDEIHLDEHDKID